MILATFYYCEEAHDQGSLQQQQQQKEFTWVLAKVSIPSHLGARQQAGRHGYGEVAENSPLISMLKTEEEGKRGIKKHSETETKRQTVHGMSS